MLIDRLKKIYGKTRSYFIDPTVYFVNYARQNNLLIGKCVWKGNADSPVCLTIDDFTNAWFDVNGNGRLEYGEDWGGKFNETNSALDFLDKMLYSKYPCIKTTFFTVVGPMNPFHISAPFTSALAINETKESIDFFRSIHFKHKYEIAYHGYDHGTPGSSNRKFFQEWEDISSVRESLEKFEKGIPIYEEVFGERPRGGKTGAYKMNAFIEESIDAEGFFWWSRNWTNKRIKKGANVLLYEPQFFGERGVIDIPSTIHGGVWYKRQLDNLLYDKQIISIQEHITPFGVDGRRIKPNILDDIYELRRLFKYLKDKNVWHATATQIAEYFHAHTFTHIYNARKDSFKIKYAGKLDNPVLTVMIDPYCLNHDRHKGYLKIVLPDHSTLAAQQYNYDKKLNIFLVDIPVQNGEYQVDWVENPVSELTAKVDIHGKISYNHARMTGVVNVTLSQELTRGFYKYLNNGKLRVIKYSDINTLSSLCVSSNNESDILIPIK